MKRGRVAAMAEFDIRWLAVFSDELSRKRRAKNEMDKAS